MWTHVTTDVVSKQAMLRSPRVDAFTPRLALAVDEVHREADLTRFLLLVAYTLPARRAAGFRDLASTFSFVVRDATGRALAFHLAEEPEDATFDGPDTPEPPGSTASGHLAARVTLAGPVAGELFVHAFVHELVSGTIAIAAVRA